MKIILDVLFIISFIVESIYVIACIIDNICLGVFILMNKKWKAFLNHITKCLIFITIFMGFWYSIGIKYTIVTVGLFLFYWGTVIMPIFAKDKYYLLDNTITRVVNFLFSFNNKNDKKK